MVTPKNNIVTKSTLTREHGKYWPVVKWTLILLAVFLVLYLGTLPARSRLADKYISRGDTYLAQGKYIGAELAYRKAELLAPKDVVAKERQDLTRKIAGDILAAKPLAAEMGLNDKLELFDLAVSVPKNEVEAVKLSRRLIEKGEYQLAVFPAETAIQMDKTYRDAWVYLGIANLKASELSELKSDIRDQYRNKAKDALQKAKDLDPNYQITIDLLATMQ